jgi:hypothetical protein
LNVGEAWEKIFSRVDFSPSIYFQKTGCMLTLDGSEDDAVRIEGMPDYKPVFVSHNDDDIDEDLLAPPIEAAPEPNSDIESEDDSGIEIDEGLRIQNENQNLDFIIMNV